MRVPRTWLAVTLVAWAALTATGASAAGDATTPRAAEGTAVLYDQINSLSGNVWGYPQDYTDPANDQYDAEIADDFTVPEGQSWTIRSVQVAGEYGAECGGTAGPATSVNVFFYANNGTVPGTQIAARTALIPTTGVANPDFTLEFTNLTLVPGTYWVSVQSVQNCTDAGEWYIEGRTVQSGNEMAYRNPANGATTDCVTFTPFSQCWGGNPDPDMAFRLIGNSYQCKGFYATQVGQAMPSQRAYASLVGTTGGDTLIGTSASDVVLGLTGNDQIKSKGGSDVVCAGPGNDIVRSGGGSDGVFGQGGNDLIKLGGGKDFVNAGGGSDVCFGGAGKDSGRCEGGHP